MRAAVYHAAGDVRVEDVERPVPGPGELLVEMRACGICGSDLTDWYVQSRAPVVLGHEPVGVIVEAGESTGPVVPGLGRRVFVHHHVPCLECELCRRGHETLCERFRATRIRPGGFSELILVPAENAALDVLEVPEHVSDGAATAIEPLACVVRGQQRAGVGGDSRLLVVGGGQIGLLHALAGRAAGAEVLIAEPLPSRRAFAERLGIAGVEAGPDAILDALGGARPTVVVLCTGAAAAWDLAQATVAKGGTIQLFALLRPGEPRSLDGHDLLFREITFGGSYSAGPADTRAALELIATGAVPTEALVTHRFELEETVQALAVARTPEALKVIVTNGGGR
jgi:L-iditol 2-dehydrogenase